MTPSRRIFQSKGHTPGHKERAQHKATRFGASAPKISYDPTALKHSQNCTALCPVSPPSEGVECGLEAASGAEAAPRRPAQGVGKREPISASDFFFSPTSRTWHSSGASFRSLRSFFAGSGRELIVFFCLALPWALALALGAQAFAFSRAPISTRCRFTASSESKISSEGLRKDASLKKSAKVICQLFGSQLGQCSGKLQGRCRPSWSTGTSS